MSSLFEKILDKVVFPLGVTMFAVALIGAFIAIPWTFSGASKCAELGCPRAKMLGHFEIYCEKREMALM